MVSEDKAWPLFRASSWSRDLPESLPQSMPTPQLPWLLSLHTELSFALQPSVSTVSTICLSSVLTSWRCFHIRHVCFSHSEMAQQPDLTPPTTGHCYLLIIYYGDSHFARILCCILKKTLHFVNFVWRYGPHRCGDQRTSVCGGVISSFPLHELQVLVLVVYIFIHKLSCWA